MIKLVLKLQILLIKKNDIYIKKRTKSVKLKGINCTFAKTLVIRTFTFELINNGRIVCKKNIQSQDHTINNRGPRPLLVSFIFFSVIII